MWPGESCTYEGVTLTWNIDPNDQLSCRYGGTLIFDASPESRLEFPIFDINDIIEYKGYYGYDPDGTEYILCTGRSIYYVAGSVFQIRYDCKAKNAEGFPDSTDLRTRDGNIDNILIPSLEFNARRQSNVPIMSSAPYENRELYLSQTIPITLNNWKMGVCESPRQYPDGSEYYELTILNSETKESFTLPLVKDATRKFGRFEITVAFFTPRTGSAQLKVNADADYTIRGLDTYIDGYSTKPPESAPFGEFLENLGQKYGFTVEWIPYPGHPESIEYARNRWSPNEFRLDSGIIKDLLIGSLKENYILDCQDPTVLKI
ncbi:MAG TPA: hypothetical protein PLZ55_13310, partial [bacterium]|nr:hypothetical protein [bacterium]